ncbi:2-oxoglutarate and oxygenase superfamily protein [Salvia divinorum]|uniref:2-oxoglutarate and oxygenase superfamily protein n=1 Tax=Salvia divinorum TaxID=28513 RepID=A0ABD1I8M7_SALDI
MGSETLIKLPVIDFSNLKHQNETREPVKIQVRKALEDYGCFEATFDEIPLHLRTSILGVEQLFDLPLTIKESHKSKMGHHGYIGKSRGFQLYESLGIEDVTSPHSIDTFTNLMWPEGNPSISESMLLYTERVSELDNIVRKMVLESLELGKYMEWKITSTPPTTLFKFEFRNTISLQTMRLTQLYLILSLCLWESLFTLAFT